ncbi:MAG: dihydrolipoamide acetyltransferase family protein [Acidimicrobiia bacterium]
MASEVLMPVITEEGEDAVVTAWMVVEGGPVKAGQLIAEVQAEKIAQEVYATQDGVVRHLVPINVAVPQGKAICVIEEGPRDEGEVEERRLEAEPAAAALDRRVPVSPAARRVARELGINLTAVTGTGPGGRITEADVQAAVSESKPGRELTGLRAVIARKMRESHATTAAVTLTTAADVTDTVPDEITAWVVKAAARALDDHPALNGTRDDDRVVPTAATAISVAIQTDEGLIAPVIRDPGSRSRPQIAGELVDLADRARAKHLTAADFEGGTFAVSNLGAYGIDFFTPIINLPQLAILGVGAIRSVPGIDAEGRIGPRRQVTLSLTFDHAFVDGAPAAAFLAQVRALLEEGRD